MASRGETLQSVHLPSNVRKDRVSVRWSQASQPGDPHLIVTLALEPEISGKGADKAGAGSMRHKVDVCEGSDSENDADESAAAQVRSAPRYVRYCPRKMFGCA